jgi:large subunit ribosomal protein L10
MSKRVKGLLMDDIRGRLDGAVDMLVVDVSKLDGVSTNRLRLALRAKQIHLLTVRNSLARRVLSDAGVKGLDPVLTGSSTLVWGGPDMVALSKEISNWVKDLAKLEIRGGTLDGTTLTAPDVEALSKSPSREELIGKIVQLALSPGARLAGALLGPGGKLAAQLKTIVEKQESPAEGDAAAAG